MLTVRSGMSNFSPVSSACRTQADAMIAACVRHALETGEKFDIPERTVMPRRRVKRPREHVDYERMVRSNSETRAMRR